MSIAEQDKSTVSKTQASPKPDFDQAIADQFASQTIGLLNKAAVAVMMSIGHRLRLFDAMSQLSASTPQQIAAAAGLQERYVREWLGAMVAGRIVVYDPQAKTYVLPAEHAAFLTRAATPNNLAGVAQWIPLMGQVEDKILDKFRNGGGVCYEEYHRFHDVMAEESGQTTVWGMLDHILPLSPGLRDRLESGIEVLDIGCGAGRALTLLAQAFPRSRFLGIDLCEDAIAMARSHAADQRLANLQFETKDDTQIEGEQRFDLITAFDAVHDQAHPVRLLEAIARLLKHDGTFLMQDIGVSSHVEKNIEHPIGAFVYTISCLHCMTVSLAQNGAGLGAAWGEELALQMLADAGFSHVVVHKLPHDIMNNYYVAKLA